MLNETVGQMLNRPLSYREQLDLYLFLLPAFLVLAGLVCLLKYLVDKYSGPDA